jgi:hypothetical protein
MAIATGRANFFGPRITNDTFSIQINANWNLLSWPFASSTNYPTGTNYINFPAGAGGTTLANSDHFYIVGSNGKTYHVRINIDGKWYYADGSYGDVVIGSEATGLYINGAFMYYNHTGGTVTWSPNRP